MKNTIEKIKGRILFQTPEMFKKLVEADLNNLIKLLKLKNEKKI